MAFFQAIARQIRRECARYLLRRALLGGLLLALWPLLSASAPLPQPACEERLASVRLRAVIEIGGVPYGEVVSWSCVSVADAQAELKRLERALRAAAAGR